MKIGILTYHSAHNYGAMLQAYALQTNLKDLGHEVQFVHYHSESLELKNRRKQKIRSLRQLVVRVAVFVLRKKFKRRFSNFESFMKSNLKCTRRYKSTDELNEDPPVFDAFICGSDQVWNMGSGGEPAFFLRFPVGDAKRISYAASFGSGSIPQEYEKRLVEWVQPFDAVSVRESTGVDILKNISGTDACQVMDPVFLLSSDEWNQIAIEPEYTREYILFYSLEPSKKVSDLLKYLSKSLNMPIVILGKGGGFVLTCKTRMAIDSGPAEFLGWFKRASFVVTNSFHATAFSIIYRKPFFTIPHSTRNARMESLLQLTGLLSRQIVDDDMLGGVSDESMRDIDYSEVVKKLELEIEKSGDFLNQALPARKVADRYECEADRKDHERALQQLVEEKDETA